MKYFLIFLLIISPLCLVAADFTCGQVSWDKYNKMMMDPVGKPVSGTVNCGNNEIRKEDSFLHGKYHGASRLWKNNILVRDITYRDGEKHGLFFQCFQKRREGFKAYTYDECKYGSYKNGKRHGKWVTFQEYDDGRKDFRFSMYSEDKLLNSYPKPEEIF